MRLLLVFLKEPIPGKVKTRLAKDVGEDTAALYYKAIVEVLLKQLRGLENCRIRFCFTPDDAEEAIRFWLLPEMGATSSDTKGLYVAPVFTSKQLDHQEIDFRAQGQGDLGERVNNAFTEGFTDGYSSIIVIGSDCPACGARWLNTAFPQLESKPSSEGIIGPSHDGGYYLLGLKSPAPFLFEDISWSCKHVLAATHTAAKNNQFTLTQLPPLGDVDHLDDWNALLASPLGAAVKKMLEKNFGGNGTASLAT